MFIVYDKNMNKKEFPQGVRPLDIYIHSIEKEPIRERIEGRSGYITTGQTHVNRPIELKVGLLSYDTIDYRLLRDEARAFFGDDEFYISESYQQGKRYKVTKLNSGIPNRLNRYIAEEVFMVDMVDLPYAESIGTTQDIQERGIHADDALWGFGMGLIADDESLIYTHNSNHFRIYNAGNERIHPYEKDLRIEIEFPSVVPINDSFQLKNITNGTTFRVNESVRDMQKIVLDGPNITSNGLQFYGNTNRQFIELEPGWNEFEVTGPIARISFDFRFYYR